MYSLISDLLMLPQGYEQYIVAVTCSFAVCITLMLVDIIVDSLKHFFHLGKERKR